MLHLYYHTPSYTHTYCTVCTVCVCCYTHTSRRKRKQRGANVQSIFRRTETKTNWFHRRRRKRHWLRLPALVCRCSHICSYYKVPWVSEVLQRDPGLWHRLSKHTTRIEKVTAYTCEQRKRCMSENCQESQNLERKERERLLRERREKCHEMGSSAISILYHMFLPPCQ